MDPENERRVFEMMVKLLSTSKDADDAPVHLSATQYFMLTPKLLPRLTFGKGMHVLVVHNGPRLVGHPRLLDVAKMIQRKKA